MSDSASNGNLNLNSNGNADATPTPTPKIHPATREILPEDPMEMHGFEVPGDPNLMLRLLVEEYARMGWGAATIVQLARDPNYQALYGLLRYTPASSPFSAAMRWRT